MSIFEFVVVLKDFFLVVFVYNIFQNGWSSDCHLTNIMTHILVAVWLFANVLVTHTVILSVFQSIFTIQILFFSSCLIVFFSLSFLVFPFRHFIGREETFWQRKSRSKSMLSALVCFFAFYFQTSCTCPSSSRALSRVWGLSLNNRSA